MIYSAQQCCVTYIPGSLSLCVLPRICHILRVLDDSSYAFIKAGYCLYLCCSVPFSMCLIGQKNEAKLSTTRPEGGTNSHLRGLTVYLESGCGNGGKGGFYEGLNIWHIWISWILPSPKHRNNAVLLTLRNLALKLIQSHKASKSLLPASRRSANSHSVRLDLQRCEHKTHFRRFAIT